MCAHCQEAKRLKAVSDQSLLPVDFQLQKERARNGWVTPREASELMGVTKGTFDKHVRANKIPGAFIQRTRPSGHNTYAVDLKVFSGWLATR